jgi:DNA modification methylase
LVEAIREFILSSPEPVHVQDLYGHLPDAKKHSIRARIYMNLGKLFQRVGPGLYVAVKGEATCVVGHGDAWQETKKLPCASVDALVTDPPYTWLQEILDIHTTTRKRMRWSFERKDVDRELGLELYRVLKEGAHAFVFVPAETAVTRPHIDRFIQLLESCGFVFNKRFIWHRDRLGMGYNGRCTYEGILFLSKGHRRKPCDLSVPDVIRAKARDRRIRLHPCEKPLQLLEGLVKFATKAGETVLDVFAGTCTTGLAALGLGRNSIMIEKDGEILKKALALGEEASCHGS